MLWVDTIAASGERGDYRMAVGACSYGEIIIAIEMEEDKCREFFVLPLSSIIKVEIEDRRSKIEHRARHFSNVSATIVASSQT